LTSDPIEHLHALTVQDLYDPVQTVILPLALRGVTLSFNVRTPSLDDWNNGHFKRLHLTLETLTWDPTTSQLVDPEASMTDYAGTIIPRNASSGGGERIRHGDAYVFHSLCSLSTDLVIFTEEDYFHTALSVHDYC
jgi:hypothetical protein